MRFVRVFGKFLISVGFGVLMFVAWTLWGTGIYTSQQQDALSQAFAGEPPIEVEDEKGFVKVEDSYKPSPGEGVFRLRIPRIDVDQVVVEGVGTEELKKGPGHYPSCGPGFDPQLCTDWEEVWPGELGRVIVSAHRTTYGAPFFDLEKLEPGDEVITRTRWGEFTYEVTRTQIVEPDSLVIVVPSERPEIVLTTCNPKFSAAQRLVVYAELVE